MIECQHCIFSDCAECSSRFKSMLIHQYDHVAILQHLVEIVSWNDESRAVAKSIDRHDMTVRIIALSVKNEFILIKNNWKKNYCENCAEMRRYE